MIKINLGEYNIIYVHNKTKKNPCLSMGVNIEFNKQMLFK